MILNGSDFDPQRARRGEDAFTYGHFEDRSPELPDDRTGWREDVRKAAASRRNPKFAVLPGEYTNKEATGSQERSK
jgi:hypothetical protein